MREYTQEQKRELLRKFHLMDLDHNGELSKSEIATCLKESHLPKDKLEEFLSLFDSDGDGVVTLDEYERALGLKEIPKSTIEEWRQAFVDMDTDKSGTLTVQEIHRGLLNIGVTIAEADIAEFIRNVDDNGDGVLSVDEFTALMRLNV